MAAVDQAETRAVWRARVAAVAAASVLVAFGAAYYLTYEPAVRIGIRWRDGVTVERRAELERRFRLVNRAPSEMQFTYDLLDTRRENIEALVNEADAEDTESLSRSTYTVPPDITYGRSWMWVRYRIPGLRTPGVVEAIVTTCIVVLTTSVRRLAKARRVRKRSVARA